MDGSADAEHALRWAVAQAVDRPIALTAVTAWSVPTIPVEAGAVLVPNMFEVEQSYLRRLERQIAAVDTRGIAISTTVAEGTPATAAWLDLLRGPYWGVLRRPFGCGGYSVFNSCSR